MRRLLPAILMVTLALAYIQLSTGHAVASSAAPTSHPAAAARTAADADPTVTAPNQQMNTVFNETLVGGFVQAGNTLLDCARDANGNVVLSPNGAADLTPPVTGCGRDIQSTLNGTYTATNTAQYNDQVVQAFMNRSSNPGLQSASSATVTIPQGAQVVYAELEWSAATYGGGVPPAGQNDVTPGQEGIITQPMLVSIGDDTDFQSETPDAGSVTTPQTPGNDAGNATGTSYYYSAWKNITPLMAGRGSASQATEITVWGANAPFWRNTSGQFGGYALNRASLGWHIAVVYQYTGGVNIALGHFAKAIELTYGLARQGVGGPNTTTTVTIPRITDPTDVQVGITAVEGDAPICGDGFSIDGNPMTQPFSGQFLPPQQSPNFFQSYTSVATQPNPNGSTDPDWNSNWSIDDLSWTLPPGTVLAGDTSMDLTTSSQGCNGVTGPQGDTYGLTGLNIAVPVAAVCLSKSVAPTYTTVGETLTYTYTVTNCSGEPLHQLTLTDNKVTALPADCDHAATLASGDAYTCTATYDVTAGDIAAGSINNTATVDGLGVAGEPVSDTASATTTTSTNLRIVKTGSSPSVNVGGSFTYTITVTNTGPGDAANVAVTDPLPAELTTWTATGSAGVIVTPGTGAAGGTLTATMPLLPHAAGSNTFTVTVTGTMAAPTTGTTVSNTATVTGSNSNCPPPPAPPGTDPNCTSTVPTEVLQHAPITITKVTDNATPTPGVPFHYTVQVTNTSTTTIAHATFSDPIPAPLTLTGWTCAATPDGTSACGTASGTTSPSGVSLTLAPLGVATFTFTVTVPTTFQGGTITNVATATPGTNTVCETPDPGVTTCSASVPVTSTPEPALLTITKRHLETTLTPGGPITYEVTVTNTSTTTIAHATFDDPVPSQIDATGGTWTAAPTGTGTTVAPATGTGFPTGQTITLTIAPGGSVTFTINAHLAATYNGTTVTNTATATPGTNTGCQDGQPTCVADDSFANPARVVIAKSHEPINPDPVPGQQVTYTVTITNPENSAVAHGTFSDPLPSELDAATATWTCAAAAAPAGSSCGTASGTGSPSGVPITMAPNGGRVTFTITATILPSETAVTVHNVGSVTPTTPGTECLDGQPTCDADDTFTATPQTALINITKSRSPASIPPPAPGEAVTYIVTVTNTSQFTTAHGTFDDPAPPQINTAGGSWSTTTTGTGTSATPASGTDDFPTGVTLVIAPAGSVTFTINAHVANPYNGSPVINTATVTPGTNTGCEDGQPTCSAQDQFTNEAKLTVTKVRANAVPTPGRQVVYRVTVTNPGSGATGAGTFSDPLPPQLDAATATWTCTASAGSTCGAASGTGSPGVPTGIPITVASNGGTVVFTITATILPSTVAVTVHNVASVTPGVDTECLDTQPTCDGEDTFTATPPPATLTITKSQTPTTPAPGDAITYTVTVANTSTTTLAVGTFDDPAPPQINTSGATWSTTTTGTGTTATPPTGTGFPGGVALSIVPGGSVTFTIDAHVANPYNGSPVTNVATVTPGTNTSCADGQPTCSADVSFTNPARLTVVKVRTPAVPTPTPGGPVTYSVIVTNPVSGADGQGTFSDPLPPELDATTATWTCAASTGSTCGTASGTGSPAGVAITVAPNGGTVTFVISATVRPSQVAVTVHNVGTVTPGPDTECMDGQPTCSGEDTFTSTPPPATVTITKSHAPSSPTQGQSFTYTVTVTNTSTTTQAEGTVDDPFDSPALTGITWTASGTGGATVTPASGSVTITGVGVVLPVGGVVTFTVHATVRSDWPGGDVINTSVVTPGTNTDCDPAPGPDPSCSAPDHFPTPSLISITKTHEPTNPAPQPGQNVTYFVTITNLSDLQAAHATFDDPLPAELDTAGATWTTTTTGTGTTVTPSSGTGSPSGVALVLGAGGTVTFQITAPILISTQGGTITNTGSAHPGDLTACETGDPVCEATDSFQPDIPPAPLLIQKSVSPDTPPLKPGDHVTYTITVTNLSPNITGHATITDSVPPGLLAGDWTATATSGSTVTPTSGSGLISAEVTVLPGGKVTFTRQGQVDPTFTGDFDVVNVATLAPGTNSLCDPNDPGTLCNADAVVHVTTPAPPSPPAPPPVVPGLPSTGWGGASVANQAVGGGASR